MRRDKTFLSNFFDNIKNISTINHFDNFVDQLSMVFNIDVKNDPTKVTISKLTSKLQDSFRHYRNITINKKFMDSNDVDEKRGNRLRTYTLF